MIVVYWLIPIPFFLLSTFALNGNVPLCITSCLILFSSYLGSFKGLSVSSFFSLGVLFYLYPAFFANTQPILFLLITLITGVLAALVRESYVAFFKEDQKEKEKVLEHLEQMKKEQAFLEFELQTLEKERFLDSLNEDVPVTLLIKQMKGLEKRCIELEEEIQVLEKIVQVVSRQPQEKNKAPRKRKPKEEKGQGLLELMLD